MDHLGRVTRDNVSRKDRAGGPRVCEVGFVSWPIPLRSTLYGLRTSMVYVHLWSLATDCFFRILCMQVLPLFEKENLTDFD